ncbi:MAG: glutathione transferase GstA [Rhodobiaceae bacterium]|nr:glutathione transferase GstA [Rhodobiaceae bacterium]
MKLYLIPSACSLAAHILVREADLNVELIKVDLATKKLPDGRAYSEIAPKGQVTASTLDNGELLTENIAVLFHLASLAPREAFLPATGTLEHIRTTEWLTYVATEMHKQIFWTIFNKQAPREYKIYIRSLLPARFAHINQQLEKTTFIAGDSFSIADTYLIWALHMVELLGETISPWQALTDYKTRMFNRPSVQAALAFEQSL